MSRVAETRRVVGPLLVVLLHLMASGAATAGPPAPVGSVAVFNFHMKSDTPDWLWLEKGLADRMITDVFRHRRFNVMQRDEMQRIVEKTPWAPELPDDERRLPPIRAGQLDLVLSGVYEVQGDRLTLTGLAVDFRTNREVARRTVSGPTEKVLDLARQLSAEMLAWLLERRTEEFLKDLPAWTRSVPAARALYEGVNLYDQGRYAEAWFLFRRAHRDDPQYVEARYWVGKMYYFMNRYDHARRALEEFVYLDPRHPRMGDAVKEYLHTYEKLDAPETALALYGKFIDRFQTDDPWETIYVHEGSFVSERRSLTEWLRHRSAKVLEQVGQPGAALDIAIALGDRPGDLSLRGMAGLVGTCVFRHHMLTGTTFRPGEIKRMILWKPVLFAEGSGERLIPADAHGFGDLSWPILFVAPEGRVFRSVRLVPTMAAAKGNLTFCLGLHVTRSFRTDDIAVQTVPAEKAARDGVRFDNVPRTGLLYARILTSADGGQRPRITSLRIAAEFEKLGAHGSVEVWCDNATDFRVDVDGRLARKGPGLIGLLPPGDHVLTFYPARADSPFGRAARAVTIRAGETADVSVRLPWAEGSPWAAWTCSRMIGGSYPGYVSTVYAERFDPPAVQADDGAIRVVWSYGGDLWSAVSTDGATFSRPRPLDLPVSSAWQEEAPRLIRDETGRFVLMFNGDRGMLHNMESYVCWSRDFEHWSAPARATGRGLYADLIQDSHGRYLAAEYPGVLWTSRDAYHWEKLSRVRSRRESASLSGFSLLEREDGRYELFVREGLYGSASRGSPPHWLYRFESDDLVHWSERQQIGHMRTWTTLCAVRAKGRTAVVVRKREGETSEFHLVGLCRTRDGTWREGAPVPGLADGSFAVAWHPRWGYLIAWATSDYYARSGPFLIRGPSLDPLFCGDGRAAGDAPGDVPASP